jgi:hypothetical protein
MIWRELLGPILLVVAILVALAMLPALAVWLR